MRRIVIETGKAFYSTGKRKTAIARVWMVPGDGTILVNSRPIEEYFSRDTLKMVIRQPLELTSNVGKFDIKVSVAGGGMSSQAGAIKHGISKALVDVDESLRQTLKKAGFLTRDARIKERKKYGKRGARRSFQYSKR